MTQLEERSRCMEQLILPELRERYSALAFHPRPVELLVLRTVFDAARRAPSAFNEQPWRYWVGSGVDPAMHDRLRSLLMEGNGWAKAAPVLILSAAHARFAHNDGANGAATHDLGAANHALMLQAHSLGLVTHAMGGFDRDAAAEVIGDPNVEPHVMIALGYPGRIDDLPEALRMRAQRRSDRRSLEEFVVGLSQ